MGLRWCEQLHADEYGGSMVDYVILAGIGALILLAVKNRWTQIKNLFLSTITGVSQFD